MPMFVLAQRMPCKHCSGQADFESEGGVPQCHSALSQQEEVCRSRLGVPRWVLVADAHLCTFPLCQLHSDIHLLAWKRRKLRRAWR